MTRYARFAIASASCLLFVKAEANQFHVAKNGNDASDGSAEAPWKSIQHGINAARAGDTVLIHKGIYSESVTVSVSGDSTSGPIVLRNNDNEDVVLDGQGLSGRTPMISITGQSHLTISGFEIRNLKSTQPNVVPVAISIDGHCNSITITQCRIHHIESLAGVNRRLAGRDAHGIAVYGNSEREISNLRIIENELHDLTLGSSEALVVNGNVDGFEIRGNVVHNCDNIGIDCIGFEGISPKDTSDQARRGIVVENHVYNIATSQNPAYGGESSAAGIYVDGGRNITIERNRVHHCDFGVEVASEHKGRITDCIRVRNNLIHQNLQAGLIIGGYDRKSTGDAHDCLISNNTFFNNDTASSGDEWGQIHLQYRVINCSFVNNIMYHSITKSGANSIMIVQWNKTGTGNRFNYNHYFGADSPVWILNDKWIEGWTAFLRHGSAGDRESFGDPGFSSAATGDWTLKPDSACVNSGDSGSIAPGALDFDGQPRIQQDEIDRGAFEHTGNK